jgi:hypothetical protein
MMARKQGVRMQVVIDEDAYHLLGTLTRPHRKGEFLSELIRRAGAERAAEHPNGIQLLQSIEEKLERIEDKLDEVSAQGGHPAPGPGDASQPS